MHMRFTAALLVALVPVVGWSPRLEAKPTNGLVRIEFVKPARVSKGDQVVTELTFRAQADLDRLDVSVAAFQGLEVVSAPQAAFTAVKRGDSPKLAVTVRITEQPFAYLSVTYETRQGKRVDGGATMVVYGVTDGQQ